MTDNSLRIPPNIKIVKDLNGLWCNSIYQFTGEKHSLFQSRWYFTVSTNHSMNSTAVFVCSDDGKYKYDLTPTDKTVQAMSSVSDKHLYVRSIFTEDEASPRASLDLKPIGLALRTVFPDTQIWEDGRICIYNDDDNDDEDVALWNIAGPEYSRYRDFIRFGTYRERNLAQVHDAFMNPDLTKDQVHELFNKLFLSQIEEYLSFRELSASAHTSTSTSSEK